MSYKKAYVIYPNQIENLDHSKAKPGAGAGAMAPEAVLLSPKRLVPAVEEPIIWEYGPLVMDTWSCW